MGGVCKGRVRGVVGVAGKGRGGSRLSREVFY